MSYETNPILARITNNKGWKNPVFPNKRLNYSYEIEVWFKIYLLLKAYLSLYQLKLLTCEIRVSENHMKILYLSVTKQFEEKKLSKSKWKAKSPLLNLQSPLAKLQNHKARFLLYQDFKTLQKQSVFTFNQWQKKILSKAWFSKPRLSSWINFSTYIGQFRRHSKIIQQLSRKSKKTFCGKKKIIVCRTKTRNLNFQQNARYNYQKKIKTLFTKTKREIWFLKKSLYTLAQYKITTSSFKYLFHKLIKQHQKKIDFLEKLTFLYQTWISVISIQQRQHPFKNFRYKIQHKKKTLFV